MLSPHAFSRPTRHKTALSLVVSVLATLFLLAPSARAQTSYPLHGTAKLRGCSGALFQYEGQPDSDLALIMTNAHCLSVDEPAFEVIHDVPFSSSITLFDANDQETGRYRTQRLIYWTMYQTDFAILELENTYAEIKDESNVAPFILSPTRPTVGDEIAVVSGFHEYVTECVIDDFVFGMEEDRWRWRDSIRYSPECDVFGGTSGSPIVDKATGLVVGVNNTVNEGDAPCTLNNPCEVDQDGNRTSLPSIGYAQQTYWVYSCLAEDFSLQLEKPGCLLPAYGGLLIEDARVSATVECDDDGTLDAGESALLTVAISNPGKRTLVDTRLVVSTESAILGFPSSSTVNVPDIAPGATVDVNVDVVLANDVVGPESIVLDLVVRNDLSKNPQVEGSVFATVNVNQTIASTAVDDVEAPTSAWTSSADATPKRWTRGLSGDDTVWYAEAIGETADKRLESPVLDVGDEPFVVSLEHRYRFEQFRGRFFDGGVIEISTDGGATWNDAEDFIVGGYPQTLTGSSNPLSRRPAFAGESEGFPQTRLLTLNFGTELAGESVRLRFRLGTDREGSSFGWEIDDINVQGITNTPFATVAEDTCRAGEDDEPDSDDEPGDDDTNDDDTDENTDDDAPVPAPPAERTPSGGCAVSASPTAAAAWPLALAILGFARRRRRR